MHASDERGAATRRLIQTAAVVLASTVSVTAVGQTTPGRAPDTKDGATPHDERAAEVYRFRLVDEDGEPAAGAQLYARRRIADTATPLWKSLGPVRADRDGRADVPAALLFRRGMPAADAHPDEKISPIYAVHERKRLVGLATVSSSDVGGEVTVQMQPACVVRGAVSSTELRELGHEVPPYRAYILLKSLPYIMKMPLWIYNKQERFECWLPPGKYIVDIFNDMSYSRTLDFEIRSDQQELDLGRFDLPARIPLKLVNRPAPPLRDIKAWKNTEPLTLEGLRGKVVLLDFWGHWCGPCLANMPELFELHDKYSERGLVMIGVHDDSVDSVADLDQKLADVRRKSWSGRDIPFPVAIAGGGETRIAVAGKTVAGTTIADYGILAWPTMIVIDREGRVVLVANNKQKAQLTRALEEMLK